MCHYKPCGSWVLLQTTCIICGNSICCLCWHLTYALLPNHSSRRTFSNYYLRWCIGWQSQCAPNYASIRSEMLSDEGPGPIDKYAGADLLYTCRLSCSWRALTSSISCCNASLQVPDNVCYIISEVWERWHSECCAGCIAINTTVIKCFGWTAIMRALGCSIKFHFAFFLSLTLQHSSCWFAMLTFARFMQGCPQILEQPSVITLKHGSHLWAKVRAERAAPCSFCRPEV